MVELSSDGSSVSVWAGDLSPDSTGTGGGGVSSLLKRGKIIKEKLLIVLTVVLL